MNIEAFPRELQPQVNWILETCGVTLAEIEESLHEDMLRDHLRRMSTTVGQQAAKAGYQRHEIPPMFHSGFSSVPLHERARHQARKFLDEEASHGNENV